ERFEIDDFAILSLARLPISPPWLIHHQCRIRSDKRDSREDNHFAKFIAVRDWRNRRVLGLFQRNGRFYAQLWVDRGYGKKAPRRFALFTTDNLRGALCNRQRKRWK